MNQKALIAEFIGAFTLIFIGVGAIAANSSMAGAVGLTGIALAHGLAIAVMVSATGAISGGHLNPAVTCGAFVAGKISVPNMIGYIIAQCLGATFAAWMLTLAIPAETLTAVNLGIPSPGLNISDGQVLIMEAVLTFFLMFVVYGTAIDRRAPKVGGLFIGLTVALDILAGGPISGAAMNPARHLGPALINGTLDNVWLYWVGPIVGSCLAALVYRNFLEEN